MSISFHFYLHFLSISIDFYEDSRRFTVCLEIVVRSTSGRRLALISTSRARFVSPSKR